MPRRLENYTAVSLDTKTFEGVRDLEMRLHIALYLLRDATDIVDRHRIYQSKEKKRCNEMLKPLKPSRQLDDLARTG